MLNSEDPVIKDAPPGSDRLPDWQRFRCPLGLDRLIDLRLASLFVGNSFVAKRQRPQRVAMNTADSLDFNPTIDAFCFDNSWSLNDRDAQQIGSIFQEAVVPVISALAPLLSPTVGALDAFGSLR
jgi:hypothetical protein